MLVTEYVTRDRLLELALDIGRAIARNAPLSVQMVKRALQDPPAGLEEALAAETRAVLACGELDDWQESGCGRARACGRGLAEPRRSAVCR